MLKIQNDCVGCDLPCIGSACPHEHVLHFYCDDCKSDVDMLYDYGNGKQLCEDCMIERVKDELPKITNDNYDLYMEGNYD